MSRILTDLALRNPVIAGVVLVLIGLVGTKMEIDSSAGFVRLLDGPVVEGRVTKVGEGESKGSTVEYSYRDPEGKRHKGSDWDDEVYITSLKRGDRVDLALDIDDYSEAMIQEKLEAKGVISLPGIRARNTVLIPIGLAIGGVLMILFKDYIGHSLD